MNKGIIIGGLIIIGVGAVNAAVNNRPQTPVFAGGVGVLVLASLLDALGGRAAALATALVGLAATTVLFVEGPALFKAIQKAQAHKGN